MKLLKPLESEMLRTVWTESRIPWENSDAIPPSSYRDTSQTRALDALSLGIHIKNEGYNIYLSGLADLGRTYMVKNFLDAHAKKRKTPPDLLYVNNFEEEDSPLLLRLPAGLGKKLKLELSAALKQIHKDLFVRFEAEKYVKGKNSLREKFLKERKTLLGKMNKAAVPYDFSLDTDEQGDLILFPLFDGKRLSEGDFDLLDNQMQRSLKEKRDTLLKSMSGMLGDLSSLELKFKEEQKKYERDIVKDLLGVHLSPLLKKICPQKNIYVEATKDLNSYFENIREDILKNYEAFLPKESTQHLDVNFSASANVENLSWRYEVNLFVDNSATEGMPIIMDDHPTFVNLLGCVERESELGALLTNFTLIKSGSLHRANGGYLIVHVNDIMQHQSAWEGLMRALRSGFISIEDPTDSLDTIRTKGILPEKLELDVKIIIVGTEDIYETLLDVDDRFAKLFKLKAQMAVETVRNVENVRAWLRNLPAIIEAAELLPFDKGALAGLVDYSSYLCQDHKKISLKFPLMRELMIEASTMAGIKKKKVVDRKILEKAIESRRYRTSMIEDLYMEEYDRNIVKIKTSGSAIGRVNGLSVTYSGDFEFGLPHQISCTVGVGHGGIIDLEREAELGGPIHTKAMMILKSYLTDQFAHNKPLVLTGSICFEQSYSGVEGDSASGAELVALLSAIAEIPVNLGLAFTGAVSQAGEILPVGGVSKKVEGFFKLCERRGLTGKQGVIIPKDNVEHLIVIPSVVEAVKNNKFFIYPVTHITEVLELLMGMPAGKRRKSGVFPPSSLFELVDNRLYELGWMAENAFKTRKRQKKKS